MSFDTQSRGRSVNDAHRRVVVPAAPQQARSIGELDGDVVGARHKHFLPRLIDVVDSQGEHKLSNRAVQQGLHKRTTTGKTVPTRRCSR